MDLCGFGLSLPCRIFHWQDLDAVERGTGESLIFGHNLIYLVQNIEIRVMI